MVVVEDESNPSWQSPKWVGARLVIQDPFIRSKVHRYHPYIT